ncbi:MAG: hypothetical protein ACRDBY_00810 [Cetobacterium sp.]
MNKRLEEFVKGIIAEGVCSRPYGLSITHEYSSAFDVTEDLPKATEMLENSGIDFYGYNFVFDCFECETCKEYDVMFPYHVELVLF